MLHILATYGSAALIVGLFTGIIYGLDELSK